MSEFGYMNPYTVEEDKERYAILGIDWEEDDWGMGGTRHFDNLKLNELKELIDKGYIDVDERQNDSPTTEDFVTLLEEYPDFHAHGYLVVNKRDDRRITLEGIESDTVYYDEDEDDAEEVDSLIDSISQRIEDMGYYPEEYGVYSNRIWFWWD